MPVMGTGKREPVELPCAEPNCIVYRVEKLAETFDNAERRDPGGWYRGTMKEAARRLREILPKEGT
jgi:hypothetical protein